MCSVAPESITQGNDVEEILVDACVPNWTRWSLAEDDNSHCKKNQYEDLLTP